MPIIVTQADEPTLARRSMFHSQPPDAAPCLSLLSHSHSHTIGSMNRAQQHLRRQIRSCDASRVTDLQAMATRRLRLAGPSSSPRRRRARRERRLRNWRRRKEIQLWSQLLFSGSRGAGYNITLSSSKAAGTRQTGNVIHLPCHRPVRFHRDRACRGVDLPLPAVATL